MVSIQDLRSKPARLDLRYVDVIQFVFQVLQLLPIRFTQETCVAFSKSMMKHQPDLD